MSFNRAEHGMSAAVAAVIVWALVPVGIRFFVFRIDPFLFNVIRFAASGAVAIPLFVRARPWRWPAEDRILLIWCAVLAVPGYNVPVALAARTVPASQLGLLIATEPVFIVLFSLLLKQQRIRGRIWIGSVLALAGVALTSQTASVSEGFNSLGTVQGLLGAASWSCYTVLAARLNQRYSTFGVTGAVVVVGAIALMALSIPMIGHTAMPDATTIAMVAGLGLASSMLGFLLWNYAAARVPAERMGLLLYLIPVVCVFAGVGFLKEPLTHQIVLGGALTVVGVWVASRLGKSVAPLATTESAG